MDFSLLLPVEISAELGRRIRARRVFLNISIEELARRIGFSDQTLSACERTGNCTLTNFARILEALDAAHELQHVLQPQTKSIAAMREQSALKTRKRAYRKKEAA